MVCQVKHNPVLLIVEDDASLSAALRRSFERRHYQVIACDSVEEVHARVQECPPQFAVVDLKLRDGSGLECVRILREFDPRINIVVLTGFASIATAVEAIKLGASHYLAKPANTDRIIESFSKASGDPSTPLRSKAISIKNVEWEMIHETLIETDFNISETARRLGMHRRTLARKLEKRRIK